MNRILAFLLLLSLSILGAPARAQVALCRAAITAAEAEFSIPDRLLLGIGRVESGRRDPQTGAFDPWPWTINAEGRGSFFPSREAAVEAVRALQASGVRSIDVGCMQINLRHHPNAFASLEEAFDPQASARYAARFLTSLQQRAGDWTVASGHYHSQTPEFAERYRARLAAVMANERRSPTPEPAALPRLAAAPPAPGGMALAAVAPPPRGALDAYRAAPIPVAGRGQNLPSQAPNPAPSAAPAPLVQVVAARAPHVVAEVGLGGIGNRRLF
ncbi:transglycosylase SLT domain-containing protein [Falsiroseomonas algicola]|uniref:transglycosylase SLT domain-containing protein n=1 Tax=Falsiroseomonas algicola TaxID=2716930 RepID=UPI001A99E297|nr:transglycosylase SLT domain-containing protein [Falsiroseomonas algicola]